MYVERNNGQIKLIRNFGMEPKDRAVFLLRWKRIPREGRDAGVVCAAADERCRLGQPAPPKSLSDRSPGPQ